MAKQKNKGLKRQRSLRWTLIIMLAISMVIFTSIFVTISQSVMPSVLLQSEQDYREEQRSTVMGLFEREQKNMLLSALDLATRPDTRTFIEGTNPHFIGTVWAGSSPAERYRVNYLFIKDAMGDELYHDSCNYMNIPVSDTPFTIPEGLSEFLRINSVTVVNQFNNGTTKDKPVAEQGIIGLLFYGPVPYYICIVPVIKSSYIRTESGAFEVVTAVLGTVVFATMVDDAYFKKLTFNDKVLYQLTIAALGDTTPASFMYTRIDADHVAVPIVYFDIYNRKIVLNMILDRPTYSAGEDILNVSFFFLIAGFAIFALLLYTMIVQYFLKPLERITKDIHLVPLSARIDEQQYRSSKELYDLTLMVNNMLERLNESLQVSEIFKDYHAGKFGIEFNYDKRGKIAK